MSPIHPPYGSARCVITLAVLFSCACNPNSQNNDNASTDTCSAAETAGCAYVPDTLYDPGAQAERSTTYFDAAGLQREVPFEVRLTAAAAQPAPVVLWSHGGASGRDDPTTVGLGFSDVFRAAGYAVVAIAHVPRSAESYSALCETVDGTACTFEPCSSATDCTSVEDEAVTCLDGTCRRWKHLSWDRPHDVSTVLDWLQDAAADGGPLNGLVDTSRIVYAGHSAGAGGTMMVAGATRDFAGEPVLRLDERPMAFISASPQGPGDDGFIEASFTGEACRALADDPALCLTRPHLALTGIGDDTTGHVAENRRLSFDLAPAKGNRHLVWLLDEAARHGTFNYESGACVSYAAGAGLDPSVYPALCETHLEWLRSAALAFLDAYVRDSERAQAWLASDALDRISDGVAEFDQR